MKHEKWLEVLPRVEEIMPVAYDHFSDYQELPYAIYLEGGASNFIADNLVYFSDDIILLEIYTEYKNLQIQRQLEEIFKEEGIIWERLPSVYIDSEKMYQTTYYLS